VSHHELCPAFTNVGVECQCDLIRLAAGSAIAALRRAVDTLNGGSSGLIWKSDVLDLIDGADR